MAFDTSAVFGRSIRNSGDPTELLQRYDTSQRQISASVEGSPVIGMRRAGRWLWVLQAIGRPDAAPGCCPLGVSAELSWRDPVSLARQASMQLDATGVMAIVNDTLWVGTVDGVVRLALDDGHRIDPKPITFGDGINVVSIADTVAAARVYVATERLQQFSVNALDAATGAITTRGPVTGGGPGAGITAGTGGIWLSYSTGSLGQSVHIDPATLTGGVTIDDNARPRALPGADLLWVDSTWGGTIGCADPATGAILWRRPVGDHTAISFAVGTDGHTNAYDAWAPIEPPALCKTH